MKLLTALSLFMGRRLVTAFVRFVKLVALGVTLLALDAPLARALNLPVLAPVLLGAGWMVIAAAITHVTRVVLFPKVDLTETMLKAIEERNMPAAIIALAICIVIAAGMMSQQARAQTMADRAAPLLPILVSEQRTHWPQMPAPYTLAGQVEAESAWRPTAELRTSREWGAGLAQLTRAYRAGGGLIFDRHADAAFLHPSLANWSWDDRFDPTRQLRTLVLMDLAEWRAVVRAASEDDHLAMMLSAYNGGRAGLARDRSLCSGTIGCDPDRWFGHTELHSWRAKTAVPEYGRSFMQINRDYANSIVKQRRWRSQYVNAWN